MARDINILFSAPMVLAQLAGTKTMTRRSLSRQPPKECGIHYMLGDESWMPKDKRTPLRNHWEAWGGQLHEQRPEGHLCGTHTVRCPYGAPGDMLLTRETFFAWGKWEKRYDKKKGRDAWHFVDMTEESGNGYLYAADGVRDTMAFIKRREDAKPMYWKRPAIFMPKAAVRIRRRITDVRVERLQEISEADAQAEGCALECMTPTGDDSGSAIYGPGGFLALWESINGAGSWDTNPWVWVISFEAP